MAMVVKNNMSAVRTLNTLNQNSSALQKSLAKVSSGMKINSAQDDASGYAISERMRVQIRSLDQANQNTQNASSLMKTAEGAVSSTVEILKSLKEKAINAATDTNTDADRQTIQKELNQFIDQIDDNALTTFNGKYLVDGSKSQEGVEVATSLTNQSLDKETKGTDALTSLKNRNGESLEIRNTDWITASYVKNGETFTTKYRVDDKTLDQVFDSLNKLDTKNPDKAFGVPETSYTEPVETMSYEKADAYITANGSNEAYARIISEDPDADEKLKEALKVVYHTNVDGTTDASAATDVSDKLSKALTDARDAIADKMNTGQSTTTQATVGQGGYKANNTITWKDEDGTTQTVTKDDWNNGAKATASGSSFDAYIKDAQDAVGKWAAASATTPQGSGAGQAAADVLSSLQDNSQAVGAAVADFRFDKDEVQKLATAELAVEAAAKVTGTRKEEPFKPHYVKADGSEDAVTTGNEYAMAQKYTLTNDQLADLGVTLTGSETATEKADKIKTALDTAISNVNGTTGGNISDATKQLKASDYINSRAQAVTQGNFTNTTATNATQAWNALDKADALYNAWQAAKADPADPNADSATGAAPTLVKDSDKVGYNTAKDTVKTADGEIGLTIQAAEKGVKGQISGVTLSISDSEGNVKKAANAALDAFKTTIYAKNKSTANEMSFQVGAGANQSIAVGLDDMRSEALGLKGADGSKVSVATQDKANAAVAVFDNALQKVLDQQATIGAIESRLEYTSQNLTTSSENVQAAESTIRDADMAKEMTNYTKNNVLLQAAQSMLAQANQNSSAVLSLLQ